ncbi:TonB-dependent siderophore receptor [Flavobacterium sp. NRK F7]|uniref:TonB-dependent receptor plug domain-containing protein n=1 Tax=Flavobacterium sp. NRK F7 TaxID=2954930 RepID=UPI002090007D|nr:TonB-dependent receptor [Flavobacterium sp. NRK F7]MCO6162053.1 TonB-dependent receptor [Flavobacterium sp. NRK F7]
MKKFLFFIQFLISVNVTYSQEIETDSLQSKVLDEVIVTATRTERSLSSLPLPSAIITADAISKAGVTRLSDIIAEQTGLITIPDFGGTEGIQMQGLDAAYTLILLDGVPLIGRSAGTLDLSRVSVGNISSIEIVKGASSSLYGSDALAGVINIITKKPKEDVLSATSAYRYATFETQDANLDLVWKKKAFSGSVFTNYFATAGYDLNEAIPEKTVEPYQNVTVQPKFYYDFSKRLQLVLGTRFYHQEQDYKATIDSESFKGLSKIKEWDTQVKVSHKWNAFIDSEYELYATNYKTDEFLNDSQGFAFENSFYNQWLFRPEIRTTFSLPKSKITTGLGLNHEALDRTYFASVAIFNSQYAFLQYDYTPTKKWNILAGFRLDNHNQYQSQWSPKIAANYKLNTHLSLKSSIGYGYKAPDFRQLYFDFTNSAIGYAVFGYNVAEERLDALDNQGQILFRTNGTDFSSELKPESSININLGSFYEKNDFKWDTNVFYNAISNLIDTKVIAQKTNGQNVFSYFNIDEIFTYGFENNFHYSFHSNLKFSLGYQYLIAKDRSVLRDLDSGNVFARDANTLESFQLKKTDYFGLFNRSKHTANFKVLYTISKLKTTFNLRVFYRSKYGIVDSNNNQILDQYDAFVKEYFLTNLSITKTFKQKMSVQIGSNNLFNFKNPNQISTLSGRQLFARMQFNL